MATVNDKTFEYLAVGVTKTTMRRLRPALDMLESQLPPDSMLAQVSPEVRQAFIVGQLLNNVASMIDDGSLEFALPEEATNGDPCSNDLLPGDENLPFTDDDLDQAMDAPDGFPPNAWVQVADRFLQCYRPGVGMLYLEWNRDDKADPELPHMTPSMREGWWLHSTAAGIHEPLYLGADPDQNVAIEEAVRTMTEREEQTSS